MSAYAQTPAAPWHEYTRRRHAVARCVGRGLHGGHGIDLHDITCLALLSRAAPEAQVASQGPGLHEQVVWKAFGLATGHLSPPAVLRDGGRQVASDVSIEFDGHGGCSLLRQPPELGHQRTIRVGQADLLDRE